MRLGVDARCLRGGPESFSGVALTTMRLLESLIAEDPALELVLFPGFKAAGAWDPTAALDPARTHVRWSRLPDRLERLLPRRSIRARSESLALFLGPDHVLPPVRGCPAVVVVHDLSIFRYPEHADRKFFAHYRSEIPRALAGAHMIVTPSSFSRSEVMALFGVAGDRIAVIPWGVDAHFRPASDRRAVAEFCRRREIEPGYLLFIGSLQPRKNLKRLLGAFLAWRRETRSPRRLVLTGATTWKSEDLVAEIESAGGAVVRLGHVPGEELPLLYAGAGAVAFPSLYEGFGLPILEALACGTPVLTANRTSCPEVAGAAALYVDPEDAQALCAGIDQILTDKKLRQYVVAQGFEQVKKFSWRKTAHLYLDLLRRVGGMPPSEAR
jgi:glycosyltransferase involved in cell wall biosynthesis